MRAERLEKWILAILIMCLGCLVAVPLLPAAPRRAAAGEGQPTVAEAEAFMKGAEERLLNLWIKYDRASWVQANFITEDTDMLAAAAQQAVIAATMELAFESTRFADLNLPTELARKFLLLRTSSSLVAPQDEAIQAELTQIAASMESRYGKGKYCPEGRDCLDLTEMNRIMANSRNYDELLDIWQGWRTISPPMRKQYQRFAELANRGAKDLGFKDLGELWRSRYDMTPAEFSAELERLWQQVKPLYDSLHCHVRAMLADKYGADRVPPGQPIPAHLLGNMWAQEWGNIYDLVALPESDPGYSVTELLQKKGVDAVEMVRYGERFFSSLGFEPLPETFWQRSLFTKPRDREVVCHASAWDIDYVDDLRIKMCIEINEEDFTTVHHELGHNYYQRAYGHQDPLHRESANDGFHEGIGDALALSITPEYLVQVGLLDQAPSAEGDLGFLMRNAMDKIAFLPFGLLVDQWRWKVFSQEISPEEYNAAWWKLREKYQGIRPAVKRSESDFDPGAKYHIPSNVPYTRYFLARILQFQFHRAMCEAAGFEGPLHRCSIYGNRKAGQRLAKMLEMGASRPWPEALAVLTGSQEMDATAIIDYFAALKTWLDEQNQGRSCGW